jgi:RNA polymerase sigma factor for flagellar operon FliA
MLATQKAGAPAFPITLTQQEAEEALIARLQPVVASIARSIHQTLPKHVIIDDLISAGNIGAIEAVRNYDPQKAKGATLRHYAAFRIRGAILDYLRGEDPVSRDTRREQRKILEALRTKSQEMKAAAHLSDIDVPIEHAHRILTMTLTPNSIDGMPMNSISDRMPGPGRRAYGTVDEELQRQLGSPEQSPEEAAARTEASAILAREIAKLPPRYQQVLALRAEDMSMKEIGRVMGVNESRISQICNECLRRIKKSLGGMKP